LLQFIKKPDSQWSPASFFVKVSPFAFVWALSEAEDNQLAYCRRKARLSSCGGNMPFFGLLYTAD